MNYNQDPFSNNNNNPQAPTSLVKEKLAQQDSHLESLHESLLAARTQTETINAELAAHNELLERLNSRVEGAVYGFEGATRRVRRLYAEMTEKRFTWTATFLIALLTILLIYLILT